MNYWIFAGGMFLGTCLGLLLAGLLGAAHSGDHPQELVQAYHDGFEAGSAKPGEMLARNVRRLDFGVDD